MLLEDDITWVFKYVYGASLIICRWKHGVAEKIRRLEGVTNELMARVPGPAIQAAIQTAIHPQEQTRPEHVEPTESTEEQTWEVDPKCEPASIPASCISEMSNPSPREALVPSPANLISRGILTRHEGEELFQRYHERLDHLLYRILGDHQSLETVLASSPLLTAAICTVAALHSQTFGHLFDKCYREFKQLVGATTFSRSHNVDDVRGLCIGAFWLHELSWSLAGTGREPTLSSNSTSITDAKNHSRPNRPRDKTKPQHLPSPKRRPLSIHANTAVLPRLRLRPPLLRPVRPPTHVPRLRQHQSSNVIPRNRTRNRRRRATRLAGENLAHLRVRLRYLRRRRRDARPAVQTRPAAPLLHRAGYLVRGLER